MIMLTVCLLRDLPKTLSLRLNLYLKSVSVKHKKCDQTLRSYSCRPIAPAWNVLFFGTDDFSAESLTALCNEIGVLNVHASLLPRWRGAAPIVYAILNGDTETGVSIMQIVPHRFDVGPVLKQMACPIGPHDTADDVRAHLARLGAEALLDVVRRLPHSLDDAMPQLEDGVTYAPKVTPALYCVDWLEMSAADVYNLCRALGHAACHWRGMALRLSRPDAPASAPPPVSRLSAPLLTAVSGGGAVSSTTPRKVRPKESFPEECPTPGTVRVHRADAKLRVMCADGSWLSFANVTVVGKKPMSAIDFYNGFLSKVPLEDWILRMRCLRRRSNLICDERFRR